MLKEFIDRENEIFNTLDRVREEEIEFILIGGYAVSAFKHRFSVDADLVIEEKELGRIAGILEKNKFKTSKSTELQNVYNGKFRVFVKKADLPVSIDLLINSVSCRQTNASWSFDTFNNNSVEKEIKGIEQSITAKIPVKELLIATKIHSCRLTDIRDTVALCDSVEAGRVITFAKRGEPNKLKENIAKFIKTLDDKNFIDAFKGVFSLEKFDKNNIKHAEEIMHKLERAIKEE